MGNPNRAPDIIMRLSMVLPLTMPKLPPLFVIDEWHVILSILSKKFQNFVFQGYSKNQ